ncbi:MAG TPA: hypothetical protein VFE05_02070 [Longimicrobiaceae bacterium]|jgi:hypothetical protein|nr:hypothetical protein [Longimicrobiaceae bacterium]
MEWAVGEFRKLMLVHLDTPLLAKVQPSVDAVLWKLNICKYHRDEATRLIHGEVPPDMEAVDVLQKILFHATGQKDPKPLCLAHMYSEAHIIAFAQSLHSTADILAQVICIVLGIDSASRRRKYSPGMKDLKENADVRSRFPLLHEAIRQLLTSPEFHYLDGYTNTVKHRSLVDTLFTLSTKEDRRGIRIQSFEYGDRKMESKWADNFIGRDFRRYWSLLCSVGMSMNDALR